MIQSVTRYPSPANHHPSLATRYPSPVFHHPLSATRHPLPVTRHPWKSAAELNNTELFLQLFHIQCREIGNNKHYEETTELEQ